MTLTRSLADRALSGETSCGSLATVTVGWCGRRWPIGEEPSGWGSEPDGGQLEQLQFYPRQVKSSRS